MRTELRKGIAILLAAVLLTAGLLTVPSFAVYAAPDDGGRVPYRFHLETLHTTSAGGSMIQVVRDLELELGQSLEAAGWLATDEGVSAYQYLWLPVGGGFGEWITVKDPHITDRPDLTAAGIEYPSGHSTAGFQFTIEPPEDLPEGYYDIYIRALDGMGTPCDLAAILNLRYGKPDLLSESGQTISIPRLEREGEASLRGGASVEDDTLRLPPDGRVRLGDLNLAGFEEVKITYYFPDAKTWKGDKTPILGLKSSGEHSYGKEDESYNVTHSLAYAPLRERAGQVTLKLTECDENGYIWLTGHLNSEIVITAIDLVGTGYTTDRVAAHINLSGDLTAYFGGFNRTEATTVTHPVLGDVLRLAVTEETNDPYAFFRVGDLLRDNDILLNADEYKYLVLLYRADPAINTDRMNLYLCSGSITGATEKCNQGVTLLRDGKWHYLLVDLSQKTNWGGIIHGWRFDYISGNSDPGDGVEFASVQFFRTAKAAHEVAGQDPLSKTPYKTGDPIVIRDMREEQDTEEGEFTLDPADTYEITEAPTEPPTEPPEDPIPSDTAGSSGETSVTSDEAPTAPPKKGCASSATSLSILLASLAAPLMIQKKSCPKRRKS